MAWRSLTVLVVVLGALAACGSSDDTADDDQPQTAADDATAEDATADGAGSDDAGDATSDDSDTAEATEDGTSGSTTECVIRLHGKGGQGGDPAVLDGDVAELSPTGNDEAWGGRQWLYFPDDRFDEAVGIVAETADQAGCDRLVVNGFSNGAAFAGALYCSGETFDGRLTGVVVDDPVPDRAVEGCAPATGVDVAVYWTGGLDGQAVPGADCEPIDWTCAGGEMIGIDAYVDAIGTAALPSAFEEHRWYRDAPEVLGFLDA